MFRTRVSEFRDFSVGDGSGAGCEHACTSCSTSHVEACSRSHCGRLLLLLFAQVFNGDEGNTDAMLVVMLVLMLTVTLAMLMMLVVMMMMLAVVVVVVVVVAVVALVVAALLLMVVGEDDNDDVSV